MRTDAVDTTMARHLQCSRIAGIFYSNRGTGIMFFMVKIIVSAIIIAVVSEISKHLTHLGGLIAAMPLTTLLTLFWLNYETGNREVITRFTVAVFWGILPTLVFFFCAIYLFKRQWNFYPVIGIRLFIYSFAALVHQRIMAP